MSDPFVRLDATAQADLVRRGEVRPSELVAAAIARIEALDRELNAVIQPRFEKATAEAAALDAGREPGGRPFAGVPIVVKDLYCHTAGDPFHRGMRFLKELDWHEEHDTHVAACLRAAGFVIVGRTNTPELGASATTEPAAYGPTHNPWDLARSPGGSSGGSAAAVAAGLVAVAQASDGGGSIRIPASACGLVGLKPTRGRVSAGPFVGENTAGLSVEGSVTRSVRDTAAVLDAIAVPLPGDPSPAPRPARPFLAEVGADPGRLRVGLLAADPAGVVTVHADCVNAAEGAARLLEALGHHVEPAYPAELADPERMQRLGAITSVSLAASLDHWAARTGRPIGEADVEPATWLLAQLGRSIGGVQLAAAREWAHVYGRRLARWWAEGWDLLLTPTLGQPPPTLGWLVPDAANPSEALARTGAFVPFTPTFNVTGQPAVSLPLSWNDDGLPVGIQLVAAYGREDLLVRVAAQLEQACPWADRWPAYSAAAPA